MDVEQNLTKKDYLDILSFYNIKIKKGTSLSIIKSKAEDLLANKLCKCIKKVDTPNESRAIAICKNSVMTKKNLGFYKFKCKNTAKFIKNKNKNKNKNKSNRGTKKIYKISK